MTTETLEQKTNEKSERIPEGFIQCTYDRNNCKTIFPEKDAKYQGPVVLCPDCYQSWFDTED